MLEYMGVFGNAYGLSFGKKGKWNCRNMVGMPLILVLHIAVAGNSVMEVYEAKPANPVDMVMGLFKR